MPEGIELLKGHVSFETAWTITDYPYGRRLRCKRAVWVETHPRFAASAIRSMAKPLMRAGILNRWKLRVAGPVCI